MTNIMLDKNDCNVHSHPLVERNKILFPPLHIKLGVMKNFVKAMDREGSGFAFLQKFTWISMEKLVAGIFDGPKIRELIKDPMFNKALSEAELSVWQILKSVVTNFLRNHQNEKCKRGIEELLKSFHRLERFR